jgi:PPOX class probable F420-dependent enzyme
MRRGLSIEQLGDLVELPLTATLATYRDDGTVLLSPVWFEWRDDGFNVVTGANGVIVKHIRRDSRVSFALHESASPWRGLEVRTTARIEEEGASEADYRIAARYLGEERAAVLAEAGSGSQVVIRLEPGGLRAWDFADDPLL